MLLNVLILTCCHVAALTAILFGDCNPSARLPITFPAFEDQQVMPPSAYPGLIDGNEATPMPRPCTGPMAGPFPTCPGGGRSVYSERLEVGYRWFEAHNATPAFCFGHVGSVESSHICAATRTLVVHSLFVIYPQHISNFFAFMLANPVMVLQGISYTRFSYGELDVRSFEDRGSFAVIFSVTNVGTVAGKETPQLYLRFPVDAGEPPKQLKGFRKTETLVPGSSELVTFTLESRDLSIWDVGVHGFVVSTGEFEVMVGSSSCDIRQRTTVIVEG
jgi:beta-glucosidase